MFSEKFKLNQTFLSNFFEAALTGNSKLHHSFMLTGSDAMAQYYTALQVAKVLNCQNGVTRSENCQCTSCLWISRNRHPAVITISPVDYTYANKDSKGSSVISVNQTRYLKENLASSSQYHRVIIFTDAVEDKVYEKKAELLWKEYIGLLTPPASSENNTETERPYWLPMPINHATFNQAAPNSLLKTIEEPEERVTFFFLTKDKEDIIDTIVSRCQVLPVKSLLRPGIHSDLFNQISECFPVNSYEQALYISDKFIEISKQESLSMESILDSMLEYFRLLLQNNVHNRVSSLKFMDCIQKLEKAKTELNSYLTPQVVLESLFLSFV